jgi:hypothetical protein
MPDPRDLVAPVDEGAEVEPTSRLRDEGPGDVDGRADDVEERDGGNAPGRIEDRRPLDDEIPHAVVPDQPPDR